MSVLADVISLIAFSAAALVAVGLVVAALSLSAAAVFLVAVAAVLVSAAVSVVSTPVFLAAPVFLVDMLSLCAPFRIASA